MNFCISIQITKKIDSMDIITMMSSNGNIFRFTGPLCGEFTGHRWISVTRPMTRSFDVFFDLRLNKSLSNQSWGWWFETPSRSLWRYCNNDPVLFVTRMTQFSDAFMCRQAKKIQLPEYAEWPWWLSDSVIVKGDAKMLFFKLLAFCNMLWLGHWIWSHLRGVVGGYFTITVYNNEFLLIYNHRKNNCL